MQKMVYKVGEKEYEVRLEQDYGIPKDQWDKVAKTIGSLAEVSSIHVDSFGTVTFTLDTRQLRGAKLEKLLKARIDSIHGIIDHKVDVIAAEKKRKQEAADQDLADQNKRISEAMAVNSHTGLYYGAEA